MPAFFMDVCFRIGKPKMKKINGEIDDVIEIFSIGMLNFLLVFLYGNNNNFPVCTRLQDAIRNTLS